MGVGDLDPLVWTPSAVRAELERVRGVLDTINLEMSRAVEGGKLTGAEWKRWHEGTYQPGHKVTDGSSLWGSNVNAARQHEQKALEWRSMVLGRGVAPIAPAAIGRKPESALPAVLGLAGIVVAGIVLVILAKGDR